MPIYRLALYAGIALVTVGIILFLFDSPRGILGSVELESNRDIRAYAVANDASTHYYNQDGTLSYTFKSKKLSHFRPDDNLEASYTSAEQPDIVAYSSSAPWHMQADSAHVDANHIITLNDNVQLEHVGEDGTTTTMETSELVFDADKKLAYTSETVTIASPLGMITAKGMRADMATRNIKLLSRVKGRHQPQTLNR